MLCAIPSPLIGEKSIRLAHGASVLHLDIHCNRAHIAFDVGLVIEHFHIDSGQNAAADDRHIIYRNCQAVAVNGGCFYGSTIRYSPYLPVK